MSKSPLSAAALDLRFEPHPLARNRHLQTVVSSMLSPRLATTMRQASEEKVLTTPAGVRLKGCYAAQKPGPGQGTVLMVHGWLGSANARYTIAAGERLYQRGYNVFRLNLRDHGGTDHLNRQPFRSDMLEEVFQAARQVAQLAPERPLHLVGASLGGNFVLRLAWRHAQSRLPNLGYTIAICPALDPYHITRALDSSPMYLAYFRRKWRRAFRQKQAAFPGQFDFRAELAASTCMEMTEIFIRNHSPYPDAMTYFEHYAVTPAMLSCLRTPALLLTAADDPIVPVEDFYPFQDISPQVQVNIQPYGGHVGFINLFPFRYWSAEATLAVLKNSQNPA